MKKWFRSMLAMLLAITMLLGVLASCDDTESTESSDVEASVEESTENSEASKSETSKDDGAELIKGDVVNNPEYATIVSNGRSYTNTVAAGDQYPDTYGIELTDGIFGKEAYWSPEWVGFLSKPEIVIDLGKTEKSIYAIEVNTLGGGSAAVYAPTEITVFVSDDGKNFTQVAFEVFSPDLGVDSQKAILRGVMLGNEASGRYVK